jgi:hypothetical protein
MPWEVSQQESQQLSREEVEEQEAITEGEA